MSHTTKPGKNLCLIHDGDLKGSALLCGLDLAGEAFEIQVDCEQFVELSDSLMEHEHELRPIQRTMITAERIGELAHMEISADATTLLRVLAHDQSAAQAVVDTVNGLLDILSAADADTDELWKEQIEKVRARLGDKAKPPA